MKIIDLSTSIHNGMEVFPGDPAVRVEQVHSFKNQGWELRRLALGSHTGTHVDAFSHMVVDGKNLDQIPISNFIGPAMAVNSTQPFPQDMGLFFRETIDINLLEKILEAQPTFIGGDISEDLERSLLEKEILTYTNLINLDQIPLETEFFFIGLPLKIQAGDGSPVRAIALLNEENDINFNLK